MRKNILITGVSRGVGLAICEILLEQGYAVYGISRKRSAKFDMLECKFPELVKFKSVDFTLKSSLKEEFHSIIPNAIPLHGYVNNAAIAYDDIITNLRLDPLLEMFQTNVFSPMMLVKWALRNMLLHKTEGSVVHVSSISVHTGYKGLSMYAATKGALEAFSKNTSREWGERGIRSNCLVAGFMETSMNASLTLEQKERIFKRTALKKATSIKSVAETVAFLLSSKSESITGQNIFVDSGTL